LALFNVEEPGHLDSKGFEYAFGIKGIVYDSIIALNYFYGLDKNPVTKNSGPPFVTQACDGKLIVHPFLQGKYPLFRLSAPLFLKISPAEIFLPRRCFSCRKV